ncbi:MAG: hypothetical protein AAF570_19445, partial [Bacteroidota bacterium]
ARKQIDNYLAYRHLLDKVYKIITSSQAAREKSDMEDFGELMENKLLSSETYATSRRAKILYNFIHRAYGTYTYDYNIAEKHAGRAVEIFEENSDLCDIWIHYYIRSLFNFAQALMVNSKYEECMALLERTYQLRTRSEKANITKFEQYYTLMFTHVTNAGMLDEGMRLIRKFESELKAFKGKLRKSMELNLYYFAALFCMVAGDFKEALKWSNAFLNEPRTEVRTDLQCSARLLNLLIHYELGNFDLIEHNLKSTYRFIFKRERMHGVERLVLRSIKQLMQAEEAESRTAILEHMHKEVERLKQDRFEMPAVAALSLGLWVESKLKGIPLAIARQEWFEIRRKEGPNLPKVKR